MAEGPCVKIDSGGEERIEPIDSDRIEIGRESFCDITIDEPRSSRSHCAVEKTKDGWKILDLESRNGTKVNGEFTNKKLLADGDQIQIGDTTLYFFESSSSVAQNQQNADPGPKKHAPEAVEPSPAQDEASAEQVEPVPDQVEPPREQVEPSPKKPKKSARSAGKSLPDRQREAAEPEVDVPQPELDTKRYEKKSSSWFGFWSIMGCAFLILIVVWIILENQRGALHRSKQAFEQANKQFMKGNFNAAIEYYDSVSSSHSNLYEKAKKRKQLAFEAQTTKKRITQMYRAQEKFYQFLDRIESKPLSRKEMNEAFDQFRSKLQSRWAPENTETRFPRLLAALERAREQMLPPSTTSPKVRWTKLEKTVSDLVENDRYGTAANRLFQFKYLTENPKYQEKADKKLEEVVTGAKIYANRQMTNLKNDVKNNMASSALKESLNVLNNLRSYHPELHKLTLDLAKTRSKILENLDSSS